MVQSRQANNYRLLPIRLVLVVAPAWGLVLLLLGLMTHTELPKDFRLPLAGANPEPVNRVYQPSDSAAVQFLIDESAGLSGSGNCIDPQQVLVVDQEDETRYDIPRFFLALWRVYHNVEAWKLNENVQAEPAELFVGLAQFGATYSQTLPITQVTNLRGELGNRYHQLFGSVADAQRGFSEQFFCQTNLDQALPQAVDSLRSVHPGEDIPRVLVLITDGVFLGFSQEDALDCQQNRLARSCARAAIETVLQDLQSQEPPVQLYVILLGADRCRHANISVPDSSCGHLSAGERSARLTDLNGWRGWASTYGFTLLESGQQSSLLVDLGESVDIKSLLPPSQRFASGWHNGGEIPIGDPSILSQEEDLRVVLVTLASTPNFKVYHNQRDTPLISHWSSMSGGSFEGNHEIPSQGSDCPPPELRLFSLQKEITYYWIVTSRGEPELTPPEIIPNPVVMSQGQEVSVTAGFESNDVDDDHLDCYFIDIQMNAEKGKRLRGQESERVSSGNFSVTENFTLNHEDVRPWGTLTITAFIYPADSREVVATRQVTVTTGYETKVLNDQSISLDRVGGMTTFMVSILYGGKILEVNPEFVPQIQLWPSHNDEELSENEREQFDGDPCYEFSPGERDERQEGPFLQEQEETSPFTLVYQVSFPFDKRLDLGCYTYLRVSYKEPNGRTVTEWISLGELGEPTPTPIPTPRAIPPPPPPPPPPPYEWWIAGLVVLLFVLVVAVSCRKRIVNFVRNRRGNG